MKNLLAPKQTQYRKSFDQKWLIQSVLFLLIVTLGVTSRVWMVDMPNFKPVAGLVLFAAFFFRRSWVAIAALFAIMLLSDLQLGVYNWKLATCVYASLAVAVAMGVWVKRSVDQQSRSRLGLKQVGRFTIASLVMSTAFYVFTNGAVWWMGQWYPATWSGLASCYAAGLPFYRATLVGDMFFTGVLVGGYIALESLQLRLEKSQATCELLSA